jgi:hypothetical protein
VSAPRSHSEEQPDGWRSFAGDVCGDVCGDCWASFEGWWIELAGVDAKAPATVEEP